MIEGTVFVIVRISNYCSAKCEGKRSLVASTRIRHTFLVSFSSHSVFRCKMDMHVEVCPCSPSMVDQSTAVDLVYYSCGCWVRCILQPQAWVMHTRTVPLCPWHGGSLWCWAPRLQAPVDLSGVL